jgi:hypothetical protein
MKLPDEIREFFRKQGSIGGKKRNRALSPEQRQESARKAAQARWSKRDEKPAAKRQPKSTTGGKQK